MEDDEIINRVANSNLISLDLEDYYHHGERVVYDLAANLFQGLILKEKDFREFIKANNWKEYTGKNVAIVCTADAILPTWAYMLLMSKLTPYANMVVAGDLANLEQALYQQAISQIDFASLKDSKVVVKGCGKFPVPVFAYAELTRKLLPIAASIMYGEPCSTVPVYKKSK
jgi:hypothetical protein